MTQAELIEEMEKHRISSPALSNCETLQDARIAILNESPGDLTGYDCPKCKNKGVIYKIDNNGYEIAAECSCMAIRRSFRRIERSGLKDKLKDCTFENYKTSEEWQNIVKENALSFAADPNGWFYIGGCPGAGKTHICTAICGELLKREIPVIYMLWRDEVVRLKGIVNDPDYEKKIQDYKKIKCLYIDDFFKAGQGSITSGDLNIAFEIINDRYNDKNLITIISSEKTIEEITAQDEALGSRIYERAKNHYLKLSGSDKNMRIKGLNNRV